MCSVLVLTLTHVVYAFIVYIIIFIAITHIDLSFNFTRGKNILVLGETGTDRLFDCCY